MFQCGENDKRKANDWRPEIHDSDGLAMWSGAAALALVAAAEAAARAELGPAVYGADADTYPAVLARLLTEARATLAIAESCTGGLIASQLAAVPGASAFLVGSAVVYTERMKTHWAHVPPELLERHGAVSRPVAVALAEGRPAMLEIDLQGARQVREAMPEALFVFLAPPSWDELVRRLVGRGTEDAEERARRLRTAQDELAAQDWFDTTIVNESVAAAGEKLVELLLDPPPVAADRRVTP